MDFLVLAISVVLVLKFCKFCSFVLLYFLRKSEINSESSESSSNPHELDPADRTVNVSNAFCSPLLITWQA